MSEQLREPRVPWHVMVGDQAPDAWLEMARATLLFHSHSAMHQAVARATGLSYHSVHKCLSGSRKPSRIPAAIGTCLNCWLDCVAAGRIPEIPDEFRAVPSERMLRLLPALLERYGTKSAVYQAVGERTGVQPATVRRYFCENGEACQAPLGVYRQARDLACGLSPSGPVNSYLADEQTRNLAHQLARMCRSVLADWKSNCDDPGLEVRYRSLRRALITTIKEQRDAVPEGCLD
jgi:hypothetical protein